MNTLYYMTTLHCICSFSLTCSIFKCPSLREMHCSTLRVPSLSPHNVRARFPKSMFLAACVARCRRPRPRVIRHAHKWFGQWSSGQGTSSIEALPCHTCYWCVFTFAHTLGIPCLPSPALLLDQFPLAEKTMIGNKTTVVFQEDCNKWLSGWKMK